VARSSPFTLTTCVCCFVLLYRYWGIVTVPGSIPYGSRPGVAGSSPCTLTTSLAIPSLVTPVPSSCDFIFPRTPITGGGTEDLRFSFTKRQIAALEAQGSDCTRQKKGYDGGSYGWKLWHDPSTTLHRALASRRAQVQGLLLHPSACSALLSQRRLQRDEFVPGPLQPRLWKKPAGPTVRLCISWRLCIFVTGLRETVRARGSECVRPCCEREHARERERERVCVGE